MNLFWKKLFRLMQPTSVFERKIMTLHTSTAIDGAEIAANEMMDKARLEALVQSTDFKQKKELFTGKKYKDTDECRIIRRYEKLLNDVNLKLYYETKNSEQLRQYLDFKSNPESLNLKDLSIVEVSARIEDLKQFEQSKAYKNFTQYHDSLAVREFEELRKKISDPDFQQANAFWANPDRWETTYEYRMELRYQELIGTTASVGSKRNKTSIFRKYSQVQLRFNEHFDWERLEETRWMAGYHSAIPRLVGNYSFTNELQANSGGRNVSVSNGVLNIHTVQLPMRALAWDVQKAFVERDFSFTSDVIQTSASFRQKYGIFSAKIKCRGAIHHALWLSGDRKLPHLNLFHFDGNDITMGNAGMHRMNEVKISGISPEQFYIYTLEWTPRELIWYVNNVEVHRTNENIPQEPLYFGVNSFIPSKMKPESGRMEVEWIKAFEVRD